MHIVHIAAEFAPFAQAGGLGEVITGLCRQLTLDGEEVDIILPKYLFLSEGGLQLVQEMPPFPCIESHVVHLNTMWVVEAENCRLHLLETDHEAGYFQHPRIYGYPDDLAKFLYFSRAALEYLKLKGESIDILHLHEWHTAICAPLVKEEMAQFPQVRSVVFTIHNLEYQGKCAVKDVDAIEISGEKYLKPESLQDNEHSSSINLLKGGIVYADAVTTVSPSYAKEILTPPFGFHLDPTLSKYKPKLFGILNGIDQKLWNPATDRHLSAPFSAEDSLSQIQKAKQQTRETLAQKWHLAMEKGPWVGAVTRLVSQKGPELIEEALHYTLEQGGVFLLLGSSSPGLLEHHFRHLQERYKNHPGLLLELNYNEPLAHQIYAAADFLLVPSHFEPCGLTQLIAMRYGTIPIVRATGGLRDTVVDCQDHTKPHAERNGFTFLTHKELIPTLERAFTMQRQESASFQGLIRHAIQADHSWRKPAAQYRKLYRFLLERQRIYAV